MNTLFLVQKYHLSMNLHIIIKIEFENSAFCCISLKNVLELYYNHI